MNSKSSNSATVRARIQSFIPFILGLTFLAGSVRSEWHYDEIIWSSKVCTDNGIDEGLFDFCAILEFCEGDAVSSITSYMNYAPPSYEYSSASLSSSMVQDFVPSSSRGASYGWRIDSSTSCSSPGPIIRLDNKNRYALLVKGATTSTATNLHTHGLHIAGSGNADDVTRTLAPGDALLYNLTLPTDHVGGTYWYHSHYHPHTKEHVTGGAFGMLIVDDDEENIGTTDPHVLQFLKKERMLILDNIQGGSGFVANGQPASETYEFQKDEWYRLRILLVSVDDYQSGTTLSFGEEGECTVYPIAHDGIPTFLVPSSTEPKSSYYLSTSSRLDVAIQCHTSAAIKVQFSTVAAIKVSSDNSTSLEAAATATPFEDGQNQWKSKRPPYLADLRELPVDDTLSITMTETSINQMPFSLETPLCNTNGQDFKYNSVVEWTLLSTTSHPFHSHMYPMQVISGCGDEHDVGEYYDTISFKNRWNSYYGSDTSKCVVRVRLIDIAGHVIVHCHILLHSEQGSMAYFNVLDGPMQPSELRALSCGNKKGNTECDPIVQPKHCSGPQYPMSHSTDMMGNAEGEMTVSMNNDNHDMMDSVNDSMMQQTVSGEQDSHETEVLPQSETTSSSNGEQQMTMSMNNDNHDMMNSVSESMMQQTVNGEQDSHETEVLLHSETTSSNNGEQQLNSNTEPVQETYNASLQNDSNIVPPDYTVNNSYSPMEYSSTSSSNTITETAVLEDMDQLPIGGDILDGNNTITSTSPPSVAVPKPTTSPTVTVEVSSGYDPDTSSYPGSMNEDIAEKSTYPDELVNNGASISSVEGAQENELSLIDTLNKSNENKNEIEGPALPKVQSSLEKLDVTSEEYALSPESVSGSSQPDSVSAVSTNPIVVTGSMPVDTSFPPDSNVSDAFSLSTNTTASMSQSSMNSERNAVTTFIVLASSTVACILIFYGVRSRKNKISDSLGRNEEEEISLNRVV